MLFSAKFCRFLLSSAAIPSTSRALFSNSSASRNPRILGHVTMTSSTNGKLSILVALDFDHTIVDANTDIELLSLAPNGFLPPKFDAARQKCWTDHMQSVFDFLHEHKIGKADYERCMRQIPLTHGFQDLLAKIKGQSNVEAIIISDSNSVLIDMILQKYELRYVFHSIYTNPAHFDADDWLRVSYCQPQTSCSSCARNICKGRLFKEHIEKRAAEGKKFDRLIYVGDGQNDFCPVQRLGPNDFACARIGYKLETLLKMNKEGQLKAKPLFWKSGDELLPCFE